MFKLLTVTLAAMFAVFYTFGDEDRRVEVSRKATNDDAAGFTLAAFNDVEIENTPLPSRSFGVSDAEAIKLALQAGKDFRSGRSTKPLYGRATATQTVEASAPAETVTQTSQAPMWYVTGSGVNLRAGPGTGNAVVGKMGFGARAEVLGDKDGWYQIRAADNSVSGWIFGKFLADTRPG